MTSPSLPRIAAAWKIILDRLSSASRPWSLVSKPIAALIASLMDLGWYPRAPDAWVDPHGVTWVLDTTSVSGNSSVLLLALERSIRVRIWTRASRGYCGNGLQHLPDFTVLRNHLASLSRKHDHAAAGEEGRQAHEAPDAPPGKGSTEGGFHGRRGP